MVGRLQVLDFLLVMDIVMQFFRAYVNKKSVLVIQLSRIRRNYLGMSRLDANIGVLVLTDADQLCVLQPCKTTCKVIFMFECKHIAGCAYKYQTTVFGLLLP